MRLHASLLATAFFTHLLAAKTYGNRLGETRNEHNPNKHPDESFDEASTDQLPTSRSLISAGNCQIINFKDELQNCYQDHCDSSSVFHGLSKEECDEFVDHLVHVQCDNLVNCRCYEDCTSGTIVDVMHCMISVDAELQSSTSQYIYEGCDPSPPKTFINLKDSAGDEIKNLGTIDLSDEWIASIEISLKAVPEDVHRNGAGSLLVSGDDASSFVVSPASYNVNQLWDQPATVTITYNPNNPGKHSAVLTSRIEAEGVEPITAFELSLVATYIAPNLDDQGKGLVYCNRCENELDFETPDV